MTHETIFCEQSAIKRRNKKEEVSALRKLNSLVYIKRLKMNNHLHLNKHLARQHVFKYADELSTCRSIRQAVFFVVFFFSINRLTKQKNNIDPCLWPLTQGHSHRSRNLCWWETLTCCHPHPCKIVELTFCYGLDSIINNHINDHRYKWKIQPVS